MVFNKYIMGLFIGLFILGSMFFNGAIVQDTSSSLNHGTKFDSWRPDTGLLTSDGCGSCHTDLTNTVGSGSLNIIGPATVNNGSTFTISTQVTGFTQAQSGAMVIGFNSLDNNNANFSVLSSMDQDFQSSVPVNSTGGTDLVNFTLTAPTTGGSYSLLAYGVHGATNTAFYYLSDTYSVTVKEAATNSTLPDADILTFKTDQAVIINDGQQDPVWANVPKTSVTEFGTGGYIQSVQDGTYLYTLLAYSSGIKWISVEFNVNKTGQDMADGTDGWVFGQYGNAKYYGDYFFTGLGSLPIQDSKNVVFSETFTSGDMNYTETARLITTPNQDHGEFQFNTSSIFNVVFASSFDHTGSHNIMTWAVTQAKPTGATSPGVTAKVSPGIDLQQISDWVFVFSVVIVIVTVFIHISLRVVSKPIKHERRIVYSNSIPNHPGSIPLIKQYLGTKFKPKAKTQAKTQPKTQAKTEETKKE